MQNKFAPVIAVTNRKGGVGKTTLAAHLAAGLAARGKRVMLADVDSQGQCALLLGQPEVNGLYETLVRHRPAPEVIQEINVETYRLADLAGGALYLLPGSGLTYSIADHIGEEDILNLFTSVAENLYLDAIIVDTQPSMTNLDGALWLAVDYFLYVTTLDRLGVAGLETALHQLINFNQNRELFGLKPTQVMGIIPNRVEKDTLVNQTVGSELAGAYGRFVWEPVMERKTWPRAAQLQRIVYQYSPSGQAAHDCWAMVKRVQAVLDAGS